MKQTKIFIFFKVPALDTECILQCGGLSSYNFNFFLVIFSLILDWKHRLHLYGVISDMFGNYIFTLFFFSKNMWLQKYPCGIWSKISEGLPGSTLLLSATRKWLENIINLKKKRRLKTMIDIYVSTKVNENVVQ